MKRIALIALICALVGAFLIPLAVRADNTYTVGFDGGDIPSWTIIAGSIQASGNPGNAIYGGIAHITEAAVRVNLPSILTVTAVGLDWKKYHPGHPTGNANPNVKLYDASDNLLSTPLSEVLSSPDNTWDTAASGAISVAGVSYAVFDVNASATWDVQVWMDNLSVTGFISSTTPTPTATLTTTPDPRLEGWNKPLRSSDQYYSDTTFHAAYSYLVGISTLDFRANSDSLLPGYDLNLAFSAARTNNVFAVVDGYISDIQQIGSGGTVRCVQIGNPPAPGGTCPIYWANMPVGQLFYLQTLDAYLVTEVLVNTWVVRYVVRNPTVQVGQNVTGGCLLGQTIPVIGFAGADLGYGGLIIQGITPDGNASWDLSSYLVNEPSGIACATTPNTPCQTVANSSFEESLDSWQSSPGGISLNVPYAPGNGLQFPATVEQTLNLDEQASYSITYSYYVQPGAGWQNMTIELGTTSNEVPISPIGAGQIVTGEIAATTYTHDRSDGLFTLRITALAGSADQTILKFICVSDSSALPITPGDGCIVLDPTFNTGSNDSPWYDIGSSPAAVFLPGMAELPDGADIQQTILLNPKADASNQDYDLAITYRRKGVIAAGENVGIEWSFGVQSGSFAAVDNQMWKSAIDTISIATLPSTASLEFDAVGSDSDQVAQISKICVTPHEGGTAPGYLPAPIFQGGCRYCVYSPTGDVATDLSEFVQWLNCQLYQLWECQAKVLLRYIWQAVTNILTLFGFFRLWLGAIIQGAVTWGNGNLIVFSRWLSGEIHNAVQNIVWAILNWHGSSAGGGTNFWDVLIALINGLFSLITVFIQLVGQIIQLIIGGLIGLIANAAGLILGLLQSIINGLNASATSVNADWLPNCNDANNSLFVVCTAIAGVESGLAIGPFALLLPVGIGLAALNLIFWGIKRVTAVVA